jgi:hypothetical protein
MTDPVVGQPVEGAAVTTDPPISTVVDTSMTDATNATHPPEVEQKHPEIISAAHTPRRDTPLMDLDAPMQADRPI